MKVKYLLPIAFAAAMFSACDDAVELPEWDYSNGQDYNGGDNTDDNTGDNTGDDNTNTGNEETNTVEIAEAWYEITSEKHFTLSQYLDSLLSIYDSFKSQRSMLEAMLSKTLELDSYSFNYMSKDENGEDIKLSGIFVVPTDGQKIGKNKFFLMDNRATQTSNAFMPSKAFGSGEIFAVLGHPTLSVDLQGYGESADRVMSYCCKHISARNAVDAILTAQFILKDKGLIDKYMSIYNIGYSMGGFNALALARYMEKEATDDEKAAINIKKSYCGAGPYNLGVYQEKVFKQTDYLYSPYMIMNIQSVFAYHGDLLGDYTIADCLTETALNSGICQMIQSGQYDNSQVVGWCYQNLGTKLADIMSKDMLDSESDLYKTFSNAISGENLLADWTPKGQIYFYHHKNDDCVPAYCTELAEQAFSGSIGLTFKYDEAATQTTQVHGEAAASFFTSVITEAITKWK